MSALVFFAGAALLIVAARAWRPLPSLRAAGAYLGLTAAFFALPLFGGRLQVGSDIPYVWRPWLEAVEEEVRPANALMWDVVLESLPYRTLVRQRLLAGEVPLWAHELGTGQPLLVSSAPFAPLHLLALPLPPIRGLTVAAAWQMLLGLLLMHALARALGAGGIGAAIAAVGFSLSTFAVAWMYHPHTMTAVWLPGVLLGVLALRRQEPLAFAGLVACGLGMALGGHPEIMAHGAIAVAAFAGALLLRGSWPRLDRLDRLDRLAFAGRLVGAGAIAACIAAPALLPLADAIPQSVRASQVARRADDLQPPPFEAGMLKPVVSPLVFGDPVAHTWSGPRTNFYELCSDYAGAVTLALALAGAAALGGRIAALVGGGAAALLAALHIAPFFDAVRLLPVVGSAPIGRLRLLWVVAVALGAGLSLERLAAEVRPTWAAVALLAATGAAVAALPPVVASPPQLVAWWAALLSVVAALAALVVPRFRPRFPAVALAGVTLELFALGVRLQPAVDPRFDLRPPATLAFLTQQARAAAAPFRVLAEGWNLHPNLAALYGLWDPRGYDPLRPVGAATVVASRLRRGQEAGDQLELSRAHDRSGLDFLAVRFLLLGHHRRLPPPWRPAFDGVGGRVWESSEALPLFFFPRQVSRVATGDAAIAQAIDNDDFAASAVRLGAGAGPPVAQSGEVRSIRPRSNGFDLELSSPTGGTVASSVSYAPGWWVAVDDREPAAASDLVNGGFLGFEVTAGQHRVRLDYRPRGWVWGLRLAALGAAAALALAVRAAVAGRQRQSLRR
jgi:hypothetical protein